MRCRRTTQNGVRCHRQVIGGSYCWQHNLRGGVSRRVSRRGFPMPKRGKWDIYGRIGCPYTYAAKAYLEKKVGHEKVMFYDITEMNPPLSVCQLRDKLGSRVGNYRTIPMIFNPQNQFIGGYSDLREII